MGRSIRLSVGTDTKTIKSTKDFVKRHGPDVWKARIVHYVLAPFLEEMKKKQPKLRLYRRVETMSVADLVAVLVLRPDLRWAVQLQASR